MTYNITHSSKQVSKLVILGNAPYVACVTYSSARSVPHGWSSLVVTQPSTSHNDVAKTDVRRTTDILTVGPQLTLSTQRLKSHGGVRIHGMDIRDDMRRCG